MTERGMGITRACGLVGISRSLFAYESKGTGDVALTERMKEMAALKRRYGYRRIHILLRREGWQTNHKRVWRLYSQAGLSVRKRRRKRIAPAERVVRPVATAPNQSWSMDFVSDGLAYGRRFRCLNIVDDYTRECLAIEVDTSLPGLRVAQVLQRLAELRGLPKSITVDNGPEFAGRALDAWAYQVGVKLSFIRPGKPVENAYIESFNGKFRDECLNEHWFMLTCSPWLVRNRCRVRSQRNGNEETIHSGASATTVFNPGLYVGAVLNLGAGQCASSTSVQYVRLKRSMKAF